MVRGTLGRDCPALRVASSRPGIRWPGSRDGSGLAALALAVAILPGGLQAQTTAPPIKDNSFLVEEAYNQEPGVVQHINTLSLVRGGEWAFSFTQEWPLGSQVHQFSFTLPAASVDGFDESHSGFGDLALNYRWQAAGLGDTPVAFAPRLSVVLPTGSAHRGLGLGSPGIQINLPLSVVTSSRVVTHWNVGATYTPRAETVDGHRGRAGGLTLAQSLVWLARPRVNLLVETVWTRFWKVTNAGRSEPKNALFVSPGIRWSHDFRNGLQVVPGVAVMLGVGPARGERAVFFYLSFEHPFRRKSGG